MTYSDRTMTWGIDKRWRKTAVDMLPRHYAPQQILDIATGTGDLVFLMNQVIESKKNNRC